MADDTPANLARSSARFGTRAVHAGQEPDPVSGAIMTPVYQTSTYVQDGVGGPTPYDYARVQNPTREALEANVAALEGGRFATSFSSGMSAIEALVKRLRAGDHVVCEENVYGGTYRMFVKIFEPLGLDFTFVDTRDPSRVGEALRDETRLVLLETPTNPMMRIADIAACAGAVGNAGALLCVDNTFASPYNQRPLELGADVVVHSTTKYINGHSDLVGGIVVTDDPDVDESVKFVRKCTGAVPGAMDAWLCLRGAKTLHARMRIHNENGLRIARFLDAHPKVESVHYPGLGSHPQADLAARQMSGFSGMVAVETGSAERAKSVAEGTRIFALAESLGGVESLISVPALMTHASVPREEREAMGITDGLLRLSVGIEDGEDLVDDLGEALDAAP